MIPIDAINNDWETTKKRYIHWWANEMYDRALICVTAPKNGVRHGEWSAGLVTARSQWIDIDYMVWRTLESIRTTYYGGEALPLLYHGWSVGHALVLGCQPHFTYDTVWTDPLPVKTDGYPSIRFRRAGSWWKWMVESTLQAAQASQGRYFVLPMWGNHAGDNLAMIRGTEALMADIVENPTWVRLSINPTKSYLR